MSLIGKLYGKFDGPADADYCGVCGMELKEMKLFGKCKKIKGNSKTQEYRSEEKFNVSVDDGDKIHLDYDVNIEMGEIADVEIFVTVVAKTRGVI